MELQDVERLIACGESETVEFKQSTGELRQSICRTRGRVYRIRREASELRAVGGSE